MCHSSESKLFGHIDQAAVSLSQVKESYKALKKIHVFSITSSKLRSVIFLLLLLLFWKIYLNFLLKNLSREQFPFFFKDICQTLTVPEAYKHIFILYVLKLHFAVLIVSKYLANWRFLWLLSHFYFLTWKSPSGFHIEKWKVSDTSWYHCFAYLWHLFSSTELSRIGK